MTKIITRMRLSVAQWLAELPERLWPVRGQHARRTGPDELWIPPTPLPALAELPPWEPRAPRYVPVPITDGEWLARERAILYAWAAEMETRIYSNVLGVQLV